MASDCFVKSLGSSGQFQTFQRGYKSGTYVVCQGCVTVSLRQQQPDQVGVAVLAGAHQRCGALVVLEVDVGAAPQEGLNHGHPAVANCEHQGCLAGLGGNTVDVRTRNLP